MKLTDEEIMKLADAYASAYSGYENECTSHDSNLRYLSELQLVRDEDRAALEAALSAKQGEGMSNALELAAIFDDELKWQTTPISRTEVAAELRRLHEQNAQLLVALKELLAEADDGIAPCPLTRDKARAAIATTERKK